MPQSQGAHARRAFTWPLDGPLDGPLAFSRGLGRARGASDAPLLALTGRLASCLARLWRLRRQTLRGPLRRWPPVRCAATALGGMRYNAGLASYTATCAATMVLEIAPLTVRSGQNAAFEHAFAQAERIIAAMPGYVSHELGHCIERPQEYMLLVRWLTLEDHEVGFRQSPQYQQWKQLLHHFYDPFPTVAHFTPVTAQTV